MVWLTKANWRTTHFSVPVLGLVVFAVAYVVNKLAIEIVEWSGEKRDNGMP